MAEFSGHFRLRASARPLGPTRLGAQSFRAPFHLSKPYWDPVSSTLIAQVVNPTAGILAGDRLDAEVTVEPGAALLLTTPSASRVFRMDQGQAQSAQRFQVDAGGWLEVWPEPLVPHTGSSFHQKTLLEVAPGGAAFFADLLMSGRVAHGESFAWRRLVLELEVRLAERLVLRERFDQTGAELQALAELARAGPTACFGNAVFVATEVIEQTTWFASLQVLHRDGVWVGASALRDPRAWSIKFVAPEGDRLRAVLREIRSVLAPLAPHLRCDPRKL